MDVEPKGCAASPGVVLFVYVLWFGGTGIPAPCHVDPEPSPPLHVGIVALLFGVGHDGVAATESILFTLEPPVQGEFRLVWGVLREVDDEEERVGVAVHAGEEFGA